MFKIVAPIKSLKGLKMLAGMGVTDFYGGLDIMNISGRNTSKAGIDSLNELKNIIKYCDENNLSFAFTLNIRPIGFSDNELNKIFNDIKEMGVKNVILNDILNINKFKDINVYISSLAAVYDKNSMDFWTKSNSVKRVILPRELTYEEKIDLINYREDLEFEIFVKNDWCYISNFSCSGIHFENKRICDREMVFKSNHEDKNKQLIKMQLSRLDCKVCELFKYKNKIKDGRNLFLKIVGREKPEHKIIKDVLFLKFVIKNIENNENVSKGIKKNVDIHNYVYKKECLKNNCEYYLK